MDSHSYDCINYPNFIGNVIILTTKDIFIAIFRIHRDHFKLELYIGEMRDELLEREIFCSPKEAEAFIDMWRKQSNTVRPHGSLGYSPPVPATFIPRPSQIFQAGLT